MSAILPPNALLDVPRTPAGLLSNREKDRLIERAFLGLYRWYTARSQETRNWNADLSFDWKSLRHDLPKEIMTTLTGFFAVEQYAPDYTAELVNMVRRSHGRSHFQLRWGSEEEKHADSWENAVLFSRQRSPQWLAEYKERLRAQQWHLLFPDAIHNLVYTVFQERATQLNYLLTQIYQRIQTNTSSSAVINGPQQGGFFSPFMTAALNPPPMVVELVIG